VRLHPAGCACDSCACDYSRLRDDFCLGTLCEVPDCYLKQALIDESLLVRFKAFKAALAGGGLVNAPVDGLPGSVGVPREIPTPPVPDCLCCAEPWVILATIQLPASTSTAIAAADISYIRRRVIYSETTLFEMMLTS
jgi:hypothetical protein